jgi:hypothetical protein
MRRLGAFTLALFLISTASGCRHSRQSLQSSIGAVSGNRVIVPAGPAERHPQWMGALETDCSNLPLTAACQVLMEVYIDGRLIKPDPREANAYLQQMCDLGKERACTALGRANPLPNPFNPAQGTPLIEKQR